MNKPFIKNDKLIFKLSVIIGIVVCLLVFILNKRFIPVPDHFPQFIYHLPLVNALLNGSCSFLLICSLIAIKKKNIVLHKKLNLTAFAFSALFLISYVMAHYFIPETIYGDVNHNQLLEPNELALVADSRTVYLALLVSHIVLAAVILPLILLSFYYGLQNEVIKHKKITRYSYPVWLYVTITGVIVYTMISKFYNF